MASPSRIFPFPHGLNSAASSHTKSIIVTSSVLDSLCLTAKTNYVPVALAEGTAHLPPDHLPFFEQFETIFLWFQNDTTSFDSARMFANKLGEKRCYLIGRDANSPSVTLKKHNETLNDIIKFKAKAYSHEYITTFESLRKDVFMEISHSQEIAGVKWKRFSALNESMQGFRRGELTVFTGKTGTGKTTFISEYSVDLSMQGINTLWGSFEIKNIKLAKMQLKQFSGINLEENLDLFDEWADRFQKLPLYYLTFHGAQEIEKVLNAMGHAVYVYDIAHVIVDNMQFMMGMSEKTMDRFYLQDMIIQKFRKFATLHNVHVTLVIHPRKEAEDMLTTNSIFGGAKATQEADNVIILQEEQLNLKNKRKFIQIAKNRFSGDLGLFPLFFNKGTLTFSKKIFQKEKNMKKKADSATSSDTKV